MAVTSSNLNRFSKFFDHWKQKEISNKTIIFHLFGHGVIFGLYCSNNFIRFGFIAQGPSLSGHSETVYL